MMERSEREIVFQFIEKWIIYIFIFLMGFLAGELHGVVRVLEEATDLIIK